MWCICAVAMVSGSLQEGACSAEERSIAPPGGEPAEGQHRRLRPDHPAALLLLTSHQIGRLDQPPSICDHAHTALLTTPYFIVIIPKNKQKQKRTGSLGIRNGIQWAKHKDFSCLSWTTQKTALVPTIKHLSKGLQTKSLFKINSHSTNKLLDGYIIVIIEI